MDNLNRYFDHTLLKADASKEQIKKLCAEAVEYDFYSVCVNSCHAAFAKKCLAGSDVKLCCVVGFPLGAMHTEAKAYEAMKACESGADEIDMVINVGALKEGDYITVSQDIAFVCETAANYGSIVKVIIETCLLTDDEKKDACELAVEAGAHFVKTSTGFSTGGATAEDVRLMKAAVGDKAKVKASGGIRDLKKVMEMIDAGADRIGASASVDIIKESR